MKNKEGERGLEQQKSQLSVMGLFIKKIIITFFTSTQYILKIEHMLDHKLSLKRF
jgi:hypothetical protein